MNQSKIQNQSNFGPAENPFVEPEKARFLLLPIPYEATVYYLPGTKKGPEAIISALHRAEFYDEETDTEPYLKGIAPVVEVAPDFSSPENMVNKIYAATTHYLRTGKTLIALGGEHTITVGLLKAHQKIFPDLKVIHLDAHLDLRDSYEGTKFNHACVIRRVLDLGVKVYSLGIRSLSREEADFLKKVKNLKVFWAKDLMAKDWPEEVISSLPPGNYYLTIDLDYFDPAFVPDVGTPEPGGLDWYTTLHFLKLLAGKVKIVGLDVVELSPQSNYVHSAFLAAKLIYKILAYLTDKS